MTRSPARPTLLLLIVAALALPRAASALEPPAPPPAIVPDLAAAAAAGPASTAAYGARCIGPAHDDTPAFQAAIDTGHTVYAPAMGGHCHITHALVMRTPGQIFGGDGRARTRIEIQPGFTGEGVFVAKTGEPGPVWRDFSVSFSQPDTDQREKLITYPEAFQVSSTPRFEIDDVGCFHATTCILMTGNSGGSTLSRLQMSAFEVGIKADGSLDTVRVQSMHWFPFAMTALQMKLFVQCQAGCPIALDIGHVDDLIVDKSLFLGGLGLRMHRTPSGLPFGSISNTDFDTTSGVLLEDGNLLVSNTFFNVGDRGARALRQFAGTLIVTSSSFLTSVQAKPLLDLRGGQTTVSASQFGTGTEDVIAIRQSQTSSLILSANHFSRQPGKTYLQPLILLIDRSRLNSFANTTDDKGGGRGVVVQAYGRSVEFESLADRNSGWQASETFHSRDYR